MYNVWCAKYRENRTAQGCDQGWSQLVRILQSLVKVELFFYHFEAHWLLYVSTIRFNMRKFIFVDEVEVLLYPMLPNFRKSTAFWKFPMIRLFVLCVRKIRGVRGSSVGRSTALQRGTIPDSVTGIFL